MRAEVSASVGRRETATLLSAWEDEQSQQQLDGMPFRSSLTFSKDTARQKNIFAVWEASLKLGGSFGVCERAVVTLLTVVCLAKGPQRIDIVLIFRTVQFVNGISGHQTKGLFVNRLIYSSYHTNCHILALFVNGIN